MSCTHQFFVTLMVQTIKSNSHTDSDHPIGNPADDSLPRGRHPQRRSTLECSRPTPARAGVALIDRELYPPESWISDRGHCTKAGIPESHWNEGILTNIRLAEAMLQRALAGGVIAGWVAADSGYGRDDKFRSLLEDRRLPYAVEVPASRPCSISTAAAASTTLVGRAPAGARRRLSTGPGVRGDPSRGEAGSRGDSAVLLRGGRATAGLSGGGVFYSVDISAINRRTVIGWVINPLTMSSLRRIARITAIPCLLKNPVGSSPPARILSWDTAINSSPVTSVTVTLGSPAISFSTKA